MKVLVVSEETHKEFMERKKTLGIKSQDKYVRVLLEQGKEFVEPTVGAKVAELAQVDVPFPGV